jgi:CRISPR-associated protein Cas2
MFIVVAYDIPDDKERTRLHKTLMRFGEPVQYSVFECILSEAQFAEMRRAVSGVVEEARTRVRYYAICEPCRAKTTTIGRARTTTIQPFYIL